MRIAYFADNSYPEMSGIVDSLLTTGEALTKKGHEVVCVGPHYSKSDYAKTLRTPPVGHAAEIVRGVRLLRIPSLPLPKSPTGQSRLGLPFGTTSHFFDSWKPDIVHTHSPYGAGIEALHISKRYQAPLIGTNHTPIEEYFPFKSAARAFDRWYYNHCVFMTTPYAELIEHMRTVGFSRPARELPNPAPLTYFHPVTQEEKTAYKKELNLPGPVVLYCGNLFIGKNVHIAMKAVAELVPKFPALTFLIVGRGEQYDRLHALARELGIANNVRFTGFIPVEKLLPYYAAADVFAIMSRVDTQSLTLMQAFATGIPAIGARARGLPDFLPETCGYLVEPDDVSACAVHIDTLLSDPALRARMGEAGIFFVSQFAPERIAERWEEIYSRALSDTSF